MPAAVDELSKAIKTFDKAISLVTKEPVGPRRWRAANSLWLSLSPRHQRIYQEVCRENAKITQEVNKFGQASGTKVGDSGHTLRNALSFPAGAYIAIAKADPTAFLLQENSKKMFDEFAEYRTRGTY